MVTWLLLPGPLLGWGLTIPRVKVTQHMTTMPLEKKQHAEWSRGGGGGGGWGGQEEEEQEQEEEGEQNTFLSFI